MKHREEHIYTAKGFDTKSLKKDQESITMYHIASKDLLSSMLFNIEDVGDYSVVQDNLDLAKSNKFFEEILKQGLPLSEDLLLSIFEQFARTNQNILLHNVYKGAHAFNKFKYFFMNHIQHLQSTGVELSQSQIRLVLSGSVSYTKFTKEILADKIVQEGMAFEIPYEDYIDDLLMKSNEIIALYLQRKGISIDQYLEREKITNKLFDLREEYFPDLKLLEEYFLITYKDNWKQLLANNDIDKESEIINSIVINFDELTDITHAIDVFEAMKRGNDI